MLPASPEPGRHYPSSERHFRAWFATDADCCDYLEWIRWPTGFVCPVCGSGGYRLSDRRYECARCHKRTSLTAGTIFDRTRTPLTVWFNAMWLFATDKDGVSALNLKRKFEVKSYQTAWAMLARLRAATLRGGKDLLRGTVEVDETLVGGHKKGQRGGRTPGEKALVVIAVERAPGKKKGFGRCRMRVIPTASAATLRKFLVASVEPGANVITDGWQAYRRATRGLYTHTRHVCPPETAPIYLPGVHRVASLMERWMLSKHQGSNNADLLDLYLSEFEFRFNRKRSGSRGLVFYRLVVMAVGHDPVRYHMLIVNQHNNKRFPTPPPRPAPRTPSVYLANPGRPWRARRLKP
ncbi:MAG: IS1595 family transposase [Acidimicrobiales bacterium]